MQNHNGKEKNLDMMLGCAKAEADYIKLQYIFQKFSIGGSF